jgi:Na+-transporting NADH:ubiquinone oxidoreductase subunit D
LRDITLGYTATLVLIATIREAVGFGTILGMRVMPGGWENWIVMSMAQGAFFLVSLFIWIMRTFSGKDVEM